MPGKSHGMTKTIVYRRWADMLQRVRRDPNYAHVKVHQPWRQFENFLADMGECEAHESLDRIDPWGNYEPGNCRWIPKNLQGRTRRDNLKLTVDGEEVFLLDYCAEHGLCYRTMVHRINKQGIAPEEAVTIDRVARDPVPQGADGRFVKKTEGLTVSASSH